MYFIYISDSYRWLRGPAVVWLFCQTNLTTKGLAWSYYTTFSKNSKMNLPILEKAMNVQSGLYTPSLRSLFRLLLRKLRIYFDVLSACSGLPAFIKSDTTRSWHRPRSPGNGSGSVCGRWFPHRWQTTGCCWPLMTISIRRQESISSDVARFSIMPQNKISQDIHGPKTLSPLDC